MAWRCGVEVATAMKEEKDIRLGGWINCGTNDMESCIV